MSLTLSVLFGHFRMAPEIMIINNNPNMTNWTFENGYDDKANENTYPIRVFNARNSAGLIITLRLWERDLEYLCGDTVQGFKLILSTPGQIPKISRHVFRVPLSEQGQILITPKLITTSDDLLHYKPSQRKCFFSYERHLRFFRIYTQNNCEAECLANFTKIECDCVKFSMTSKRFLTLRFHLFAHREIVPFGFYFRRCEYTHLWCFTN